MEIDGRLTAAEIFRPLEATIRRNNAEMSPDDFRIARTATSVTLVELLNLEGLTEHVDRRRRSFRQIRDEVRPGCSFEAGIISEPRIPVGSYSRTGVAEIVIRPRAEGRVVQIRRRSRGHEIRHRPITSDDHGASDGRGRADRDVDAFALLRPWQAGREVVVPLAAFQQNIISSRIRTITGMNGNRVLEVFIAEPLIPNEIVGSRPEGAVRTRSPLSGCPCSRTESRRRSRWTPVH